MPLDDLGEIVVRFTGRVLVRFLIEILFDILCYYIGRIFLLIVSLGQYRSKNISSKDGTLESIVGLALLIACLVIYALIKNT